MGNTRLLMSKQFHSSLCCQDNLIIIFCVACVAGAIFCVYINLIRPLPPSEFGNTRLIQIKNFHMSGTRFDFVQNGLQSLYFNG